MTQVQEKEREKTLPQTELLLLLPSYPSLAPPPHVSSPPPWHLLLVDYTTVLPLIASVLAQNEKFHNTMFSDCFTVLCKRAPNLGFPLPGQV